MQQGRSGLPEDEQLLVLGGAEPVEDDAIALYSRPA